MSDLIGALLSCIQTASADLPGFDLAHKPFRDIAAGDAKEPEEQSSEIIQSKCVDRSTRNISSLKERCYFKKKKMETVLCTDMTNVSAQTRPKKTELNITATKLLHLILITP